jgi:formylglycine-generating enzyme required for sulfatase activity
MRSNTDQVDPVNQVPDFDGSHAARGGARYSYAQFCRSARRDWDLMNDRFRDLGFRIVMELTEEEFLRYARQYRSG